MKMLRPKETGEFPTKLIIFVTNTNWYFWTHRLPMANALRDNGWEVEVAAPDDAPWATEKIERAGFIFHPIDLNRRSRNPLVQLRTAYQLVRIYRKRSPLAVHHITIQSVILGTIAAKISRVPMVVNAIAGLGWGFSFPSIVGRMRRVLLTGAYRILLRGENINLLFQNQSDRRFFERNNIGHSTRRHRIPGSGVPENWAVPQKTPSGTFRVLCASRMIWEKGVGRAVEAVGKLAAEGHDINLVIAGKIDPGNPDHISSQTLTDWGKRPEIEWVGEHENIAELMGSCHVVCLPTTYGEGIPRVLIEAAASGRTIISSRTAGCDEIVVDGETGILVDPRVPEELTAALLDLMQNPSRVQSMGEKGRHHFLSHFTEKIVGNAIVNLYANLRENLNGQSATSQNATPSH